ncbi:phosphatase [Purpureocillium lavendulum]|uniref:Phosphatase n=1 Tax=Purpureocillium lavendulum TaxID=1247861 RepID=A0AB34G245_9HYPO|nr:phosphatase [Purpureocillium lavendulum]
MADTAPFSLDSASLPLRNLPSGSYLVHATNCIATWGAGIAAEMADIFPAACREYKRFCIEEGGSSDNGTKDGDDPSRRQQQQQRRRWPTRSPIGGRCLVIPPQDADVRAGAPRVHIVCLFTSSGYGRADPARGKPGRDAPARILEQTASSLRAFRAALAETPAPTVKKTKAEAGAGVREATADINAADGRAVIYSPMFNSGAFKVPWDKTEALIRDEFRDWPGRWAVLAPPRSG